MKGGGNREDAEWREREHRGDRMEGGENRKGTNLRDKRIEK